MQEIAAASKNDGFALTYQKKYQLSCDFVKAVDPIRRIPG
jgi:hypothetical protein